jgi:acyl-homoserine lactone acylase PvdQ
VTTRLFGSAIVALSLAGSVAAQDSASLQRKAEAAVAQIRGSARVSGLEDVVRVQRDRWGVAHIYAGNSHDLFFAQGYVVAQDRLFQMELWKRSGQGRLAEVLGPEAIARDVNARRLFYRGDMQAEFLSYAPDAKAPTSPRSRSPVAEVSRSNFRLPASDPNPGIRSIASIGWQHIQRPAMP